MDKLMAKIKKRIIPLTRALEPQTGIAGAEGYIKGFLWSRVKIRAGESTEYIVVSLYFFWEIIQIDLEPDELTKINEMIDAEKSGQKPSGGLLRKSVCNLTLRQIGQKIKENKITIQGN